MVGYMNMVAPDSSYPSYRETENLSIEDWLNTAVLKGETVTHDHMLAHAQFPNNHLMIIDETSQHILLTKDMEVDESRSRFAEVSRVENDKRLRRTELSDTPEWTSIGYGAKAIGKVSPLLANLAREVPGLSRYVHEFNPDDILQSHKLIRSNEYTKEEKISAYRKLMGLAPKVFGRFLNGDSVRGFGESLSASIQLASETDDCVGAIYLSNILSLHGALPDTLHKNGITLRDTFIKTLATKPDSRFASDIDAYSDLLTSKDITDLLQARKDYENGLKAAQNEGREEVFYRDTIHQLKTAYETGKILIDITVPLLSTDNPLAGSLGDKTSEAVRTAATNQAAQFVKANQAGLIEGDLTHLIEINPSSSIHAMNAMLEGRTPEEAERLLVGAELMLLRSPETGLFSGAPTAVVDEMWETLETGARACGHELPYSRENLQTHLPEILARYPEIANPASARPRLHT
jgi:hypothetical protein